MHTYLYSCVFNARGQESGGNWGNSLVKTRPYMVRFHTLSLTERTTYGICLCPKSFFKLCFHKISFFRRGQLILNGCHSTKIKWWNSPLHNYIVLYILVSRRSLSLRGTEKVFQWACGPLLWLLDGTSWMASKGGTEREWKRSRVYVVCFLLWLGNTLINWILTFFWVLN